MSGKVNTYIENTAQDTTQLDWLVRERSESGAHFGGIHQCFCKLLTTILILHIYFIYLLMNVVYAIFSPTSHTLLYESLKADS